MRFERTNGQYCVDGTPTKQLIDNAVKHGLATRPARVLDDRDIINLEHKVKMDLRREKEGR